MCAEADLIVREGMVRRPIRDLCPFDYVAHNCLFPSNFCGINLFIPIYLLLWLHPWFATACCLVSRRHRV